MISEYIEGDQLNYTSGTVTSMALCNTAVTPVR